MWIPLPPLVVLCVLRQRQASATERGFERTILALPLWSGPWAQPAGQLPSWQWLVYLRPSGVLDQPLSSGHLHVLLMSTSLNLHVMSCSC
jgi:hypothetical protein